MATQLQVSLIAKLEGDMKVQIEAIDQRIAKMEKTVKQAEGGVKGLGTAFQQAQGMLAAFGVQATFQGLIQGIKSAITEFAHFRDLAHQTGIAIEDIAAIDLIAKTSGGTGADDFLMMIRQSSKAIEEAQRNAEGPASQAFKALSDAMKDASFNAKNLAEMDLIDRLKLLISVTGRMKDTTDSSVISQTLLGKSFMLVKGIAKDLGDDGFDTLRKKSADMNPHIKEAADRANEFNTAMTLTKETFKGYFVDVVLFMTRLSEMQKSRAWENVNMVGMGFSANVKAAIKQIDDADTARENSRALNPWKTGEIDPVLETAEQKAAREARKAMLKAAADEARQERKRLHDEVIGDTEAALKKELQKTVEGLNQIQAERMIHAQNLKDQGVISATELADYQVQMAADTAERIGAIQAKQSEAFGKYMQEEIEAAKRAADSKIAAIESTLRMAEAETQASARITSARHGAGQITDIEAETAAYAAQAQSIRDNIQAAREKQASLAGIVEKQDEYKQLSGEIAVLEREGATAATEHAIALEQLGGSARSGAAGVRAALTRMRSDSENTFQRMKELTENFASSFKSGFADAFASFSSNAASAGDAFKQFGLSMIDTMQRMAAEQLATQIFGMFLKVGTSAFAGGAPAVDAAAVNAMPSPFPSAGGAMKAGAFAGPLQYQAGASQAPAITIVNNISAVDSGGVAALVSRKDFQDSQKNQIKGWFANDRGMRGSVRGALG